MKNYSILFIALLLLTLIGGCRKDKEAPTLSLLSPFEAAQVTAGTALSIKGKVADNEALHELSIVVNKSPLGAQPFASAPVVHELKSYDFDLTWATTPADTGVYLLTITVSGHADNINVRKINFTVKP